MKQAQAALAIFALTISLTGAAHGQAVEKKQVMLAVGGKTALYYLPLTICERLGYFKEQGLDVTINDFRGGAQSLQALVAAPSTSSPAPTSTPSACRPRARTSGP